MRESLSIDIFRAGVGQQIKEHLLRRAKPATLSAAISEAINESDIINDLSRELAAVNLIKTSNEPENISNSNFIGQNRPQNQGFQRFTQMSRNFCPYYRFNNRFNNQPYNRFNNQQFNRFNNRTFRSNFNNNRYNNVRNNANFVNPTIKSKKEVEADIELII